MKRFCKKWTEKEKPPNVELLPVNVLNRYTF